MSKKYPVKNLYIISAPNKYNILKIWLLFYVVAFITEWFGHLIGIWIWSDTNLIFIHAAAWWANILTLNILLFADYKSIIRYFIFLAWVLTFEILQQKYILFVSHTPILNTPYITIIIVMSIVSALNFKVIPILIRLNLIAKNKLSA
ncbi:MAG: hypothetical protein ACP6IY_11160 [Promethearchaeia archaeon]